MTANGCNGIHIQRRSKTPKEPGRLLLELTWLCVVSLPMIFWAIVQKLLNQNKKSLGGETVLITGAGNGLGRELALRMANKGCRLALVDVNEEAVTETAKEINSIRENTAKSYVANLGVAEDIKKLSQQIAGDFARVDILVNNAGVIYGGRAVSEDITHLDAMFQVNVLSHFRMVHEFLPGMIKRNHGHIVAVSSSSAYVALANASMYSSTKWAINGMMESLRQELREIPNCEVKTTIVAPYFINTDPFYTEKWDIRLPALSVRKAAAAVIEGIEREDDEFSIPSFHYPFLILQKLLPRGLRDMFLSVFYTKVLTVSDVEKESIRNVKILEAVVD